MNKLRKPALLDEPTNPNVASAHHTSPAFRRDSALLEIRGLGRKSMFRKLLLGLTVIALAGAGAALAQQSGIKRTALQKVDFPPGYNTVTAIAEVPAGGASGRHTRPGAETGYLLEGELELLIDGKPPLKLKAGDSYQIPEGAVHDAKTSGDQPLKVLGVYVVKAGEPLAKPAP
ncbi:quercetin dioxygenase-like cupin family protein [Bradyrhizobium sp. USDA 4524]